MKKQFWVFSFFLMSCGVNTNTPTAPFLSLVPIAIPQVFSVIPIDANVSDPAVPGSLLPISPNFSGSPRPEYLIRYFVTNREPQFVGYNLYITTVTPTIADTLTAEWLEDGIAPSFRHLAIEASTDSRSVVTKRIKYRIPPPGLLPFQRCQIFNFTLRALFNNGLISNPSAPVSVCALPTSLFTLQPATANFICESSSPCAACASSTCTNPSLCPVGTPCNPCKISGNTNPMNCQCTPGTFPPGCYL